MGNELFGVDIAGLLADAIGDGVLPVTITRDVRAARVPGDLTGGRPSQPVSYECMGFWDDIDPRGVPPGITIEITDRKLVLIGDTVPPDGLPLRNDACTVHEEAAPITLYCVQALSRDPAAAVYAYLCRDRGGPGAE